MLSDFKDKTVIVTGGSRGIGQACAQLFAALSANVIITFKENIEAAENTIQSLHGHGRHQAFKVDLADPVAIENFFTEVQQAYDRLDVLVNNAGIFIEHKIADVSYAQWQQAWKDTMSVNLDGVGNCCYFAARQMMKQHYGKIINISSRGAFRGEPDHPAYGASKAGVNALSQSLAKALGQYNIVVAAIAPGFVATDMVTGYLQGEAGNAIRGQSPMNRVATPEEVARVVASVASDGVEFMTGGIIDVNGASYLRS